MGCVASNLKIHRESAPARAGADLDPQRFPGQAPQMSTQPRVPLEQLGNPGRGGRIGDLPKDLRAVPQVDAEHHRGVRALLVVSTPLHHAIGSLEQQLEGVHGQKLAHFTSNQLNAANAGPWGRGERVQHGRDVGVRGRGRGRGRCGPGCGRCSQSPHQYRRLRRRTPTFPRSRERGRRSRRSHPIEAEHAFSGEHLGRRRAT